MGVVAFGEAGLERRRNVRITRIVPAVPLASMVAAAVLGALLAVAGLPLGVYERLACAALQAGCPATAPPAGSLPRATRLTAVQVALSGSYAGLGDSYSSGEGVCTPRPSPAGTPGTRAASRPGRARPAATARRARTCRWSRAPTASAAARGSGRAAAPPPANSSGASTGSAPRSPGWSPRPAW
ncbi:hypothetical protein MTP10_12595 [Nonomuraea sp. 3-1Str]|uniref:hypothetical protein n=1 Tax=Nonomuraea sp. 3-1Str TaxID=2929801 RepID=UPI0028630423|nr:hypothetical protein [Nonomuraea sp. 3-1Str]MDR8409577.1 hypothetical protein [Nonomuraea sp. 3-1Str]